MAHLLVITLLAACAGSPAPTAEAAESAESSASAVSTPVSRAVRDRIERRLEARPRAVQLEDETHAALLPH